MTMTIMPQGRQRYYDNDGNVAAGCLLYTYAAGTTTPQAAYQDSSGLVPHTNPIVLDAKGEAVIFWSGAYKVDLKTALGVQITNWPVDNLTAPLTPSDLSANTGGGLIGFLYAAVYGVGTIGRWLQDLALAAGSTFMGWLQAGAGAVLQTVHQRFRSERVLITDFLSDAKRTTLLAGTQTDVTVELQTALDSFATFGTVEVFGNMKITATIFMKRSGMRLVGRGVGNTTIEYVNAAGGTAFSGHVTDTSIITNCEIACLSIAGPTPGTAAGVCLDITTFAYSIFDRISFQTKRVGGTCIYGEGNSGSSPYYNTISNIQLFGNTDYSQTGIHFTAGAWTGGSNGPNANIIGPILRAAALGTLVNLEVGNGNLFSDINGESIGDYYFKLNSNSPVANGTGTSTGSNTMGTLNDTGKTWTINEFANHAVKIASGTGANQVRKIASNTATRLTLANGWGVLPDATSVYEIYKASASSNKVINVRAEGLSSENPDFIYAAPGTYGNCFFNTSVESLGTGLTVRDESGNPSNQWYNGHKVVFTEYLTNPGASYSADIYPRNSVYGGVLLTNYVIEWMSVSINAATPGGVLTAKLDVAGTAAGGGDMTLTAVIANTDYAFVMPGKTEKIIRDGTNKHVFLNVATDASFSATADVVVTWCATIDV
jgi:hypothetical protein